MERKITPTKIWKYNTGEGLRSIPVTEMSDTHIQNTLIKLYDDLYGITKRPSGIGSDTKMTKEQIEKWIDVFVAIAKQRDIKIYRGDRLTVGRRSERKRAFKEIHGGRMKKILGE